MPHARQQIRDLVVSALGRATHPVMLAPKDVYQISDGEAVIFVYIAADRPVPELRTKEFEVREAVVAVEIRSRRAGDVAESLDAEALIVERDVVADDLLLAAVHDVNFEGVSFDLSGESEAKSALAVCQFSVVYRINRKHPEVLVK